MKKECSNTKEYVKNGKFNDFLHSIVRQDISKNVYTLMLHSEYIKKPFLVVKKILYSIIECYLYKYTKWK